MRSSFLLIASLGIYSLFCPINLMPFDQLRGENTQWEKEKLFPTVPFTEPNGLWALNALINQYLSLYINNATKLGKAVVTKELHFHAHKIALRLVFLTCSFIMHDYTFTRQRAFRSALNTLRWVVTKFPHEYAGYSDEVIMYLIALDCIKHQDIQI